jgi:hypothetical protein
VRRHTGRGVGAVWGRRRGPVAVQGGRHTRCCMGCGGGCGRGTARARRHRQVIVPAGAVLQAPRGRFRRRWGRALKGHAHALSGPVVNSGPRGCAGGRDEQTVRYCTRAVRNQTAARALRRLPLPCRRS